MRLPAKLSANLSVNQELNLNNNKTRKFSMTRFYLCCCVVTTINGISGGQMPLWYGMVWYHMVWYGRRHTSGSQCVRKSWRKSSSEHFAVSAPGESKIEDTSTQRPPTATTASIVSRILSNNRIRINSIAFSVILCIILCTFRQRLVGGAFFSFDHQNVRYC